MHLGLKVETCASAKLVGSQDRDIERSKVPTWLKNKIGKEKYARRRRKGVEDGVLRFASCQPGNMSKSLGVSRV